MVKGLFVLSEYKKRKREGAALLFDKNIVTTSSAVSSTK